MTPIPQPLARASSIALSSWAGPSLRSGATIPYRAILTRELFLKPFAVFLDERRRTAAALLAA